MKPTRRQWTLGFAEYMTHIAFTFPFVKLPFGEFTGNMFEHILQYLFVLTTSCSKSQEVVCVLKALSEDGELSLSDGRTIVRPDSPARHGNVVRMSPDFRLIVLANRPGYPFMGVFSLIQFACLYFS